MIVCDLVRVTATLAQVVLHINGQLELCLDDLNENFLGHEAFLVGLTAEGDECVEVLIGFIFLLILQLKIFKEGQCHQERLLRDDLLVFLVKEHIDLL